MMRYGIPEYRLPKATLDAEIATITALGVKIICGKSLGTHLRLQDLQQDFDAVYLAIGSWTPTPMGLEGENSDGVWTGIRYLEHVTKGTDPDPGRRGCRRRRRQHRHRLRPHGAAPWRRARGAPLPPYP